jgi:glycine oxidase
VSEPTDVIVIGAGIIGCAITRELARRGAKVLVFEARSVGAGATQASAGVLAPYIEAPRPGALLDLTTRSLAMYDDFVADVRAEAGMDVEYRRCGTIEVAENDEAAARLQRRIEQNDGRAGQLEWLDRDAVHAVEPALTETVRGGLVEPTHGYVQVARLTEALVWASMRHGVEWETHRRIASIEPATAGEGLDVISEDGSRWTARTVIVATGSWAPQGLAREPAAAAVRPVRGQLVKVAWQGPPVRHIVWGPNCYVVPWLDGTALVGATVEEVGFDERTTAAGVRDLLEAVCELIPEAWKATFLEARVGLRPASADGLPIIGPSARLPGLVFATGHYRNGVLLAPVTASIVSDLVLHDKHDPSLRALTPTRFG